MPPPERPQVTPDFAPNHWDQENLYDAATTYFTWAVEQHLADPGQPGGLSKLAAPIEAHLAQEHETDQGAATDNRHELLRLLEERYPPALGDESADQDLPNLRSASRALISHTLRNVQLRAMQHDAPALSRQVISTVCTLAEKEKSMEEKKKDAPLNWWLTSILQDTVAVQMDTQEMYARPGYNYHNTPAWIRPGDRTRTHNALIHAIATNEDLVVRPSTVDFLMKHHGLHPETFLAAWRIGFSQKHTPEKIIKFNLLHMAKIEAAQPGICQRLLENNGIRCLARYSEELLLYVDDFYAPRDRTRECATIHTAIYDHNGAFSRPGRYDTLKKQAVAAGRNFDVYEWGSVAEREQMEMQARERNPHTVDKLEQGHSDGDSVMYGDPESADIDVFYTRSDMERDEERIHALHVGIAHLAFNGCSAGRKYAIAQTLSAITDAEISGQSKTSGVSVRYSKTAGFTLTPKNQAPAGLFTAPRSTLAYVLLPPRIKTYRDPHTVSGRRALDEAAHLMSMLAS